MPVPKSDLKRIFQSMYPGRTRVTTLALSGAHRLALVFMVFVIGTLYDLSLDRASASIKAEEFLKLVKAALASDPLTEHTTLPGLQTLVSSWVTKCK